jgi:hypothetical protein
MKENDDKEQRGEIVVYNTEDGHSKIRVILRGDSVWLTQRLLSELYDVGVNTINHHIKEIFKDGELDPHSTIRKYRIVQKEGKREVERIVDHYNLDMIIAVGYRVRSPRGIQFRQWATEKLREYIVKGFTIDDERLKGEDGLVDYFYELLARIREIRASEARVYQRIREIFSLACDYKEGEKVTQQFYALMQNKMHFAASGMTAAEIIRERADSKIKNMGLTSWKGGRVLKRDVGTAKNYLNSEEIDTLNRITVMFLDQAEFRTKRRMDIRMKDWEYFLDKFLVDTDLPVLEGPGKVSNESAINWASQEYEKFLERRRSYAEAEAEARYISDLQESARLLEAGRTKPKSTSKKQSSKDNKSNDEE